MPSWLGARADAGWKQATDAFSSFQPFSDYLLGKQIGLKIEGEKLNLASQALGVQQQEQQVGLTQMKMQDQETGIGEVADYQKRWMSEGQGSPQWIANNPGQFKSRTAQDWYQNAQEAADRTTAVQTAKDTQHAAITGIVQSNASFANRVQSLGSEYPSALSELMPYAASGQPIPKEAWDKLGGYEAQYKAGEDARLAAIQAQMDAAQKQGHRVSATYKDGRIVGFRDLGTASAGSGADKVLQVQEAINRYKDDLKNTEDVDEQATIQETIDALEKRKEHLNKFAGEIATVKEESLITDEKGVTTGKRTITGPVGKVKSVAPLPLPKSKDELKKDVQYQLPQGVYTWDGTNFVK